MPVISVAGVNPKNGNFYIACAAIFLENNGHELGIARTYNSKSTVSGWFGYGWGSSYETRLIVMPDGSAVVRENGSGRSMFYRTKSEVAIKAWIDIRSASVTCV